MKVAHVQPMTFDLFGQDEMEFGKSVRYFLPNIAELQAQAGDTPVIHLLTNRRSSRLDFDGIDVFFHRCTEPPEWLGYRARFARQLSLSMLRSVAATDASIIHFHGALSFQLMFAAVASVARRRQLPLVASEQGVRSVRLLESWAQTFALHRANAITANSRDSAKLLISLGASAKSVHVVPNGVDTSLFQPSPISPIPDPRPLKVVTVCRITAEKDPMTLARGVARLHEMGYGVELTWVGQGNLRPKVEKELRPLGGAVHFIDHMPQQQLPDLHRSAHVFVLTSLREGMPQVVLEAMACGLTVVASDVSGTRDAVGDGGILIPAGDPNRLARELALLVDQPQRLVDFRELAILNASRFSWTSVIQQLKDVYEKAARELRHAHKGGAT
jgi:glycosyltransferase involved in cell wall biosynthesis